MMPSSNDRDCDTDRRLGAWLRETSVGEPSGVAEHVAKARIALLARLEAASPASVHAAQHTGAWNTLRRFVASHRIALGSIGATTALAVALAIAMFNSGQRLSAMERMAEELRRITSYSCRATGTNTGIDDDGKRVTIKDQEIASWLAPGAYYQETKIVRIIEDADGGNHAEKILADFEEALPLGKPGACIDHRYKTFVRITYDPTDEPIGSKTYPWEFLRLIREGSYDVLGDLGTKRIGDMNAHGYRLTLKNQRDKKNALHDPLELWADSGTNLPVDVSWSGESEGWKYAERVTDFRWNVVLDRKRFEPAIPSGYADITPPTDEKEFAQIAAALRLYSQLSGGHYPQTRKFDAGTIRAEMKKLAGFAGTAQPEWASDKKFQKIEHATAGLNWIERILRIRFLSGYRGLDVGPADKDKVLLWWLASKDRYRVFYGDLRSEVLSEAQWSKLVPSDEASGDRESQ